MDTRRFRDPVLLALLLAFLAVGAAVLFARGPAVQDRTTHVWQPATTEKSATEPLVLVAGTTDELSVTLPCRERADLPSRFTVRTTPSTEGLVISGAEARLTIHIDGSELAAVPWLEKGTAEACRQTISFDDRGLTVAGIDGVVSHQSPGPAPTVALLAIDSTEAIDGAFRVEATTQAHGSSPSGVQWLAGILAIAFALGATGVALRLSQTQPPDHSSRERLSLSTFRPIWLDGLIVGSTVIWMFIGPAFYDDGWVLARHRSFAEVGRFTNYYSVAGVEMPLGYWNDWLAHWWNTALTAPIALRVLPATLIVAGWLVLRLALTATAPPRWRNRLTTSTMAAGYLIGSSAWLMTLRPEPLVAVLCAISIYGVAVFLRRATLTYLVAAAAAAVFAATSHPAGLVACAPLVAATPGLFRWSKARAGRVLPLLTLLLAMTSLGIVLFFLDSDLGLKLDAMAAFRETAHSMGPLDEPLRYVWLATKDGGTVLRRLFVGLGGLTIVLFAMRAWRRPEAMVNLASWSLIIGTLLLWITPSKWVWHFGTMVPYVAIALSIEFGSLVAPRGARLRRAIAVIGVAAAATFAWGGTQESNPLDLVELAWTDLPLTNTPFWFWMLTAVVVIAATAGYAALRQARVRDALATSPSILVILVATLAILGTSVVLVRDAATTESWTFALQNGQTLLGRNSCGLADSIYATSTTGIQRFAAISPESAAADQAAAEHGFPRGDDFHEDWYPTGEQLDGPTGLLGVHAYGSLPPEWPTSRNDYEGSSLGPWQRLTPSIERVYLQSAGGRPDDTLLGVQFGRIEDGSVVPTSVERIETGPYTLAWTSIEVDVPRDSDVARVVAVDEASAFGGWLAYTELFGIAGPELDLAAVMADPSIVALVPPQFVMYFPCANQPSIARGVAAVPDVIVAGVQPKDVFAPVEDLRRYEATSVFPIVVWIDADSDLVNREASE